MASGPPAEYGESSSIAPIMIELERVISVRNKSSSRRVVTFKRKKVTEVGLGMVNTLVNWLANKQHISYLLSVNMLSSTPTSCLQMLYLLTT